MRRLGTWWLVVCGMTLPAGAGRSAPPVGPGICAIPPWRADGGQLDGRFGTVAPAGDVNGDGYADVLVGAYNYDDPEADEGKVWLYFGSPSGLSPAPAWTVGSDQAGAHLGDKLCGAGDVNGDGYDDVILGAGLYDHGQTDEGKAYLHLGSPTGLAGTPAWTAEGNQAGANFGACVQPAGDVNGDGYDDVIIGAWLWDGGQVDEGGAFVYLGSASGLATVPAWTGESNSAGAVYGYFCTGAGDLNGDGYDDIVVGARRFAGNGLTREGRVYVYYGSPSGPSIAPDWIEDGGQARGEYGTSPAGAGDVNGDGYDDLVVNAWRYDHPDDEEGMAWLYLGSAAGLSHTPSWSGEGDQMMGHYAYHVDAAGDMNGDGYGDVLVSAINLDVGSIPSAGRAFLYLGSASGLSAAPSWTQDGDQPNGEIGHAARGVGDVNGDGRPDIMTGALYYDVTFLDEGRAYLFYGCPEGVTDVSPARGTGVTLAWAGANPFARPADFVFEVATPGRARLAVYDLAGRLVTPVFDATVDAGRHTARWSAGEGGASLPSGIYVARLDAGGVIRRLKLTRLR